MNLFPIIISCISIFSPYILNITENKGGLMVFVKSHIPLRRLNDFKIPSNIQIIPFKINLRNEKWLVASIYKAHQCKYFLLYLINLLEFYSAQYEKVIIFDDFNMEAKSKAMKDFLHAIYNIMKQNTCFKGNGGSCIYLLITNSKFSFMKTNSFEAGLSDHYHLIHAILKTKFEKFEPKKSIYRISNSMVVTSLNWMFSIICLLWEPMQPLKIIFVSILDKHAAKKTKNITMESKTPF